MAYHITYKGVLLHQSTPNPANAHDDRTVQVCAMGNTAQPVLPLYGIVSNKCALDQESTTSLMFKKDTTNICVFRDMQI